MGLSSVSDKHEFTPLLVEIEQKPASPLGRILLWVILAFIVLALLWLFFAKIDVVVSARGKVIPFGEVKTLQPIESGAISAILVKEGQIVKKGEVIMEIDPSVSKSDLQSKQKNLELLNLELARLKALISNKPFVVTSQSTDAIVSQQLMYNAVKNGYIQQCQMIYEQTNQVKEQIKGLKSDQNRVSLLLKQTNEKEANLKKILDIIAKKEYDEVVTRQIEYQEQIKTKEYEISAQQAKLTELQKHLNLTREEYLNKLLGEFTQKNKEVALLKTEVQTALFRTQKQQIISPVDGYIGKLFVHTLGGVVTPAEKLATIIPNGVPLVIKATVLNQDIGFVTKQMPTEIKIDTYDFQKYGMIKGIVSHISDDAIEDEKLGPVYEIIIFPKQLTLHTNNEIYTISSGMSVSAELKVGKRRVIEFFIYPMIKYLDEGLSVR